MTAHAFKLPVLATVVRSYRFAWVRRSALALPLLLVFILKAGMGLYLGTIEGRGRQAQAIMAIPDMILLIAVSVFAMSVAVGIHRTVILEEDRHGLRFWRRSGTLGSYFWTAFGLGFLGIVFSLILAYFFTHFAEAMGWWQRPPAIAGRHRQSFPAGAIWAAGAIYMFLFLRFMLALPAAAIGDHDGIRLSFRDTHGNWLRLTAVAILTALPWLALTAVSVALTRDQINEAMRTGVSPHYYSAPAYVALSSAIYVIELAVLSAMLSISYGQLARGRTPKPQ